MPGLEHTQDLVRDLRSRCLHEATADVILKVQDELLPAHKLILTSRSEYFEKMLSGKMKEKHAREIRLKCDFSPSTVKQLLHYIYTGSVEYHSCDEGVMLVACADFMGFSKLRDDLRHQVEEALSCDTFYEVLTTAVKCHQEQLVEKCLEFVPMYATFVFHSECFEKLDVTTALRVLEADGMQSRLHLCLEAAASWYMRWASFADEGENPEHTNRHLRTMRQYIDTLGKQLRDQPIQAQACSVDAPPGIMAATHVSTMTVIRRDHDEAGGWRAVVVTPLTTRTRLEVRRMSQDLGPRLVVALPDAPLDCLVDEDWDEDTGGAHWPIAVDGTSYHCDRLVYDELDGFHWHPNTIVDVVTSRLRSGKQEVTLLHRADDGDVELVRKVVGDGGEQTIVIWVGLRHPGDEVSVTCVA